MGKIPLQEDKFIRGIIAGAIAGLVKDIPPIIIHLAHSEVFPTYWDYAGMIGMGKIPNTTPDITVAILIQLVFSMLLGVFLIYAINAIASQHYLIKGALLGGAIWFLIRAAVWIANVKDFNQPQYFAFIINSTSSVGYGMLVAYIDRWLQKYKKRTRDWI